MASCCKYCDRAKKNDKMCLIEVGGICVWVHACHKHKELIIYALEHTGISKGKFKPGGKLDDFDGKI